jgi:hypothetical protein
MNQRTLLRALAVAVALAALSPLLFATDSNCGVQNLAAQIPGASKLQEQEFERTVEFDLQAWSSNPFINPGP